MLNPLRLALLSALPLLASCGQDISITESSHCDGALQNSEDTVDSPYDQDGDGYFDGTNADCVATYSAERLDCDDLNPEVNPGLDEISCDGFDNDCNAETIDAVDKDEDGASVCIDCDDNDPLRSPLLTEVDCNGLDDDCDDTTPDGEDIDGDGALHCDDCDDTEERATPGKEETCDDNIDNDCDGETDENCEATTMDGTWELDTIVTL